MNRSISISGALSAATCTLLSSTAAAETDSGSAWVTETALLLYVERGRRTEAVEPVILATKTLAEEDELRLRFAIDVITGASPTGAMPSSRAQTFTRPSGIGNYTISPGELPVDDTFMDTRVAASVERERRVGPRNKIIYGGSASYEYDFISLAATANYVQEFNQRNTSLSSRLGVEVNRLDPEGGVPIPLSTAMIPAGAPQNRQSAEEDRHQVDILFGLTQVLSPKSLMQFNVGYSESDGYHTDPFKFVSIVNALPGLNFGEPLDNVFENRPEKRTRRSMFLKLMRHLEKDIVGLSYRYFKDDWDVESHTLDLRYTIMPRGSRHNKWQPRVRWYRQEAASFYRTNLLNLESLPQFVSADYRLGEMDSVTLGVKYSTRGREKPFEVRVEYISQDNRASAGSRIGYLQDREIVPDTKAVLVQFNYIF